MIADYILRVDSLVTYTYSCHRCLLKFFIVLRLRLSKLTCFQRPMIIEVSEGFVALGTLYSYSVNVS